jgi:GT2 family glycosyltransferase
MSFESGNGQVGADLLISIVNHNSKDLLKDCVKSIYETVQDTTFEICVVNNTPRDGCTEMLESEFPEVRLIHNRTPSGFAANHNKVVSRGSERYFLLLNPDTVVGSQTIDALVQFMDCHPEAGMVGPKILRPDGAPESARMDMGRPSVNIIHFASFISDIDLSTVTAAIKSRQDKEPPALSPDSPSIGSDFCECSFLSGSCLLVRREVIDEVGLMDERFLLYFEETDWEKRTHDAGWKLYFLPNVWIVHIGGQSTKTSPSEYLQYLKVFVESALLFYQKHYGLLMTFLLRTVLTGVTLANLVRWPIVYLLRWDQRDRARRYFKFAYRLLPVLLFR